MPHSTNTLDDLTRATGGRPLTSDVARDAELGPAAIDSRRVEPGEVFWAMRGPNYDGADFADEAFRRGAAGVVTTRAIDAPKGHWAVQVDDTAEALQRWAEYRRRHFTGTVIGVTGSVGKTTTRQMIHTVLQSRLSGTASPRNYNNHVGLPLSMFALRPDHDYSVLELGASRPGEIAALAGLCRPKVGVITQIGDAHLGGFGNRQGIARAKAELLAALPPDGRAVLGDDPWLRSVAEGCHAEVTWVGTGDNCHVRAADVHTGQGHLTFRVEDCRFRVPVWGRHHLSSALAAVGVARILGFDLDEIAAALGNFDPVPMRCEVFEIREATVINDTYNSNPTAMQAALELVRDFDVTGRRIVVAGDMGELATEAISRHFQLGRQIVATGGAELLIACGRFARYVTAGARSLGMPPARAICCETVDEALPHLGQTLQPGDLVLIKGSRMMAMERLVEALQQYPKRRSA
ncbi:MAG: UDP-N-acetylmuramoyl-tripeptide--D-alanyl-D-alanine ligase [Candidatus Nealsonbacteria bacterium]|nr:UDP-N-acetylmuramoyl-tripeptide--D-alanyl-D-alanine ligase [Candidatus Nealsonbacteria bacterium]